MTRAIRFRLSKSFVISLIVHALVLAGLWWQESKLEPSGSVAQQMTGQTKNENNDESSVSPDVIQVRSLSPEDLRRIVQTQAADEDQLIDDEDDVETMFLSDRTQRVKKQTRATEFGSVAGSGKNADGKDQTAESAQERMARLEKIKGLWELPPPNQKFESAGNSDLSRGNMDLLNDNISVSSGTLLNTDEYKYASFFNRIKEAVAPRWEPRIQVFLRKTMVLGQGIFSTKCAFWLDAEGEVQRVDVIESSGSNELDLIARQSIAEVGTFLNPPETLKSENGLFKVELGFLVDATQPRVRTRYVPDPRLNPPQRERNSN